MLLVSSNTLDCYSNEEQDKSIYIGTNNNYVEVSSSSVVIMASDETSDNPVIVKKMKDTNACMPNDMGTGSQSQNAVIQPLLTGTSFLHLKKHIFISLTTQKY